MHISEHNLEEENRRLRRTMRDLVALSTLPAVWTSLGPDGIARSLADVLFNTLSLDLVYIRLRGLMGEGVIEVVHTKHGSDAAHEETVKASIDSILSPEAVEPRSAIPNPFGEGALHLAITRFGLAGDVGVLIAGSQNAEFPTENDRLLLGVGANQTTIVLQRLKAEEQVREQGERLRTTLACIGDAVITTDTQGCCTNLNAVAEILTGWTNAVAVGQPLDDVFRIVNEKTRQPVTNPAKRALGEGAIIGLANHTILIGKDGTERPIDDSAAPIRCEEGEIVGCVLVFRDVTERRQAELSLQTSEERFRSLLLAITSIVWTTDAEGRFITPQPSWTKYTGQSWDELRDFGWFNAIHPEGREKVQRLWEAACASKTLFQSEGRLWHEPSQSYRHFEARGVPILEADGAVREWVGKCVDVEDRWQAEAQLHKNKDQLRLALDSAELGSWHVDPATNDLQTDKRFRDIFGVAAESVTFDQAVSIIHPEDRDHVLKAVEAAIRPENPEPYVAEYRVVHPNDTIRWVYAKGRGNFALVDGKSRLTSFDGTVMDITEKRQMREELRELAGRLSEADRRKDEFLATLAHELRNPLAPIRTGLEIMKMVKDDPTTLEEIRCTMERQTQQLITLVDDLLDVSRITKGKLELRKCRVKLAEVVQSAVEACQPFIVEAGHELTVAIPDQPICLDADPNRLAQVLSNLLNNSAKYTPQGGRIRLSAEQERSDVVISVEDNGLGIPAEMLERIFEMFGQIDRPHEKGHTGLGIGLSLVKSLVEMHDGRIEVRSEGVGKGSVFSVRLPILVETPVEERTPAWSDETAKAGAKRTVLVVDDNKAAATMLSMVVKKLGNEVRKAHDGQEAIEVAAEFLPEVILMDIEMPKMDGYKTARHIRQQSWGNAVMLVALTGWGQEEDKQKTREAGFDYHLVKPVEPAALQELLANVNSNPSQ